MSTELITSQQMLPELTWDNGKRQLLKDTLCKGSTDAEFELFLHACKRTGLDPFMRQIYPVKRWDSNLKRESMTIQTGIDGYRLIAERTAKYAPGPEPTFAYKEDGSLDSSTSYVKKLTSDGTWHIVAACAYYDEYCQKTKDGNPNHMWRSMPRNQLAKCAESLALRKAFPAELSGVYTKDEMAQSNIDESHDTVSLEQARDLQMIIDQCDPKYQEVIGKSLAKNKWSGLHQLPISTYESLLPVAIENRNSYQASRTINVDAVKEFAKAMDGE